MIDPDNRSWIVPHCVCKVCGFNLIVTQPSKPGCDYWWYCSNKGCRNHEGTQLGDQESWDQIKWLPKKRK